MGTASVCGFAAIIRTPKTKAEREVYQVYMVYSACFSANDMIRVETGALLPLTWGWNIDEEEGKRGSA